MVSSSPSTGRLLVEPGFEQTWIVAQDEDHRWLSYELALTEYDESGLSILDAYLDPVAMSPASIAFLEEQFEQEYATFALSEDGGQVAVMQFADAEETGQVPVHVVDVARDEVRTVTLVGPELVDCLGVGRHPYIVYDNGFDGSIRFVDWTSGIEYGVPCTHPPATESSETSLHFVAAIYAG